ncbi:pyruvate dehydrogenase (lipoamide) kinase, putative [Trypanosoma cruzi]|nr:pyruvate dehydrogenase (lipoamide) kinase, putative [Trypanosoma cruzi]
MKRLRILKLAGYGRNLILRPEATKDPYRYPLGYVPLDGSEPLDSIWALVKNGFFVAPLNKIETIHRAHLGIRYLTQSEYPAISATDLVGLQLRLKELCSRLLIRRDFWVLEDFNDPELNTSFGIQNVFFDNFKWSQVLWKRFQVFVEEYFPVMDHTHLTYDEYIQLLRSFSHFEQGATLAPLLPRRHKVHPPFGVSAPSKLDMEPLLLYMQWLRNFRGPLMLNKALIVWSGCGSAAFATRYCGVPIVRGVDPNPRAVSSSRKDAQLMGKQFDSISFRVSEMLPDTNVYEKSSKLRKCDLIFFYPDQGSLNSFFAEADNGYAPGMNGFAGQLEQFFDEADKHLAESGVLAICCTNLYSILKPHEPNPIEYEIKVNRRWILLDYYDLPIRSKGIFAHIPSENRFRFPRELKKHFRSELWILHKVESLIHFAYIHQIPGAQPPSSVASYWRNKGINKLRRAAMKNQVELMGGDWGDYKNRMMQMLQEQSGDDEDDVAQAVRMALDPTYPLELAERARVAVEKNKEIERAFHAEVANRFIEVSPRDCFDAKSAKLKP